MRRKWIHESVGISESISLTKRLLKDTLVKHWKLYVISLLCILVLAASTSGFVLTMKQMVNSILVDRDSQKTIFVAGLVVSLSLLKAIAGYIYSITANKFRKKIEASFQLRQFEKVLEKSLDTVIKRHASEFVSDIMFNARGCAAAVITILNNTLSNSLTLLFLIIVMFITDPVLSFGILIIFPILIIFLSYFVKKIKRLAQEQISLISEVTAIATEALQGIKVVKSFGLEKDTSKGLARSIQRLERSVKQTTKFSALVAPLMELLGGLVVAGLIFYAGFVATGDMRTAGDYMAFIAAFLFAYEPAKKLANVNTQLHKQFIAVSRFYKLIDEIQTTDHQTGTVSPRDGSIEFSGVSFAYDSENSSLKNISFRIESGEKVAIVGRSGSGKTTLTNLIHGFYRPQSGVIRIGDIDVSSISFEKLREFISLISQDIFLFDGTIGENIRSGNKLADEAQLLTVLRGSTVYDFLEQNLSNLERDVGPNGCLLSGGQRQRVAIARALLKGAPILIYDEATSALDMETEAKILEYSFNTILEDTTIICVAHRLSTIASFPRILFFDKGELVADGTFENLSRNEEFRLVFNLG